MEDRKVAIGLGWFSIALGVTEIVAAKALAKALGLRSANLVRALGVREIVAGVGLLARHDKGPWVWARILGDALDLGVLGSALAGRQSKNAAVALAAVAPVVGIDLVYGKKFGLN